jgi:hypothetical protein
MDEQRYLVAEDLLLLLLDDERGSLLTDPINVDAGLAGAILLELAQRGRVRVHEAAGAPATQVVRVRDASTTGDDLLDEALRAVAERDRTATGVVEHLSRGLRHKLLDRLAARGILEHEEGRLLGVFPRHRWPAHDDRHEMALRAGIRDSLVQGEAPTERVAALIALLDAIGAEHRVLPFPGVSNRQLRARAAELSKENLWAAGSTQPAESVDVVSATRAAIAATTITASSSYPGGG